MHQCALSSVVLLQVNWLSCHPVSFLSFSLQLLGSPEVKAEPVFSLWFLKLGWSLRMVSCTPGLWALSDHSVPGLVVIHVTLSWHLAVPGQYEARCLSSLFMATEASEIFQMAQIITHSPRILIYWSVRMNLDRIRETFSLPRVLDTESSFLAASSPVSKHSRWLDQ